jgi:hypothetical protein
MVLIFIQMNNVLETGFCLRLQVVPAQSPCLRRDRLAIYLLGPTELTPLKDLNRIQSPKRNVLNKRQGNG